MRTFAYVAIVALLSSAPFAASADPNPDSAAGNCGQVNPTHNGLGDSIGQDFVPTLKALAEAAGMSLGQYKKASGQPNGYGVPDACAPGHQPS